MENQDGFKELLADDTVIYAVLKKLHITKAHNDYDDLISEGRLLYLKAYATNHHTGKRRFNYFFTKIYWGLLDYLCKQQRNHEVEAPIISATNEDWDIVDERVDVHAGIEDAELLAAIRAICTAKEWLYVEQRLQGKKVAEIAAQIGVHPAVKPACERKLNLFLKKINFEGGKNRGSIR